MPSNIVFNGRKSSVFKKLLMYGARAQLQLDCWPDDPERDIEVARLFNSLRGCVKPSRGDFAVAQISRLYVAGPLQGSAKSAVDEALVVLVIAVFPAESE
jgi:hypothetical protein